MAISDHRSSQPTRQELLRIAADALRAEQELQLAETGECSLEVLVEELLAILCQRLTLEGKALHIAKEQIALQLWRETRRHPRPTRKPRNTRSHRWAYSSMTNTST